MRTLEQWLDHQARVHPQTIDLDLERLRRVLERLHWRQPTVPIITVAGTNGKGSVSAYCASILNHAGYRVGTFTSPHLRDYRERIRVHDRLVTRDELSWAFDKIEAARLGTGGAGDELSLTFFEYNTLAALLLFEAAKLDAWVLEVGLGGRLDAVNVVDPSVAVLVSVALDHQEFLGETLDAIAREKAGIFRKGRPAVLGSRTLPDSVPALVAASGAIAKRLGIEFSFTRGGERWHYHGPRWKFADLPLPAMVGDAQLTNAATAIAALEELDYRLSVSLDAVVSGLTSTRLQGRFQVIAPRAGGPQWILDVAHNPAAARTLAENLRAMPTAGRTLAVCGLLADKDAEGIANELRGRFDAWWWASTDGIRGTQAAQMAARLAPLLQVPTVAVADVAGACAAAAATATAQDRIVVFGSFHTVGPALDWLESSGVLPPSNLS